MANRSESSGFFGVLLGLVVLFAIGIGILFVNGRLGTVNTAALKAEAQKITGTTGSR